MLINELYQLIAVREYIHNIYYNDMKLDKNIHNKISLLLPLINNKINKILLSDDFKSYIDPTFKVKLEEIEVEETKDESK